MIVETKKTRRTQKVEEEIEEEENPLLGQYHPEDLHEYRVNRHGFEIFLAGEQKYWHDGEEIEVEPGVDYRMATRLMINIAMLSDINPEKPILIHMKTCGGDWSEGMAMYDTICACPNPVTILSYTHARSMSSIILQAADRRVLMPNSYFMFHLGELGYQGTHKGTVTNVNWINRVSVPVMIDIYAREMKRKGRFRSLSIKEIKKIIEREMDRKEDVFLTARQAVRWGLADSVFNTRKGDWDRLRTRKKRVV